MNNQTEIDIMWIETKASEFAKATAAGTVVVKFNRKTDAWDWATFSKHWSLSGGEVSEKGSAPSERGAKIAGARALGE